MMPKPERTTIIRKIGQTNLTVLNQTLLNLSSSVPPLVMALTAFFLPQIQAIRTAVQSAISGYAILQMKLSYSEKIS